MRRVLIAAALAASGISAPAAAAEAKVAASQAKVAAAQAKVAAAQAKVVWVDPTCQYFIADLGGEFGIYNWRAGAAPSEGDVMEGNTQGAGLLELNNLTHGGKNAVITMAISPTIHSLIHSSPVQCERRWKKQ